MRKNTIDDFYKYVDKHGPNGCWVWTSSTRGNGYGVFKYRGNLWGSHRFMAMVIMGRQVEEPNCVLHKCDNPLCCNPDHLFIGTRSDNMYDMHNKKRHGTKKGSDHYRSKVTENEVLQIRRVYGQGVTSQRKLANDFGITRQAVKFIVRRETWKHI